MTQFESLSGEVSPPADRSHRRDGAEGARSFDAFYEAEYAVALRMALAFTGDRQEAEDIASEVFVDAYRRWSKISTYDHPQAWVRRAVANQASSFRRRLFNWNRLTNRYRSNSSEEAPPPPNEELWREVADLPRRQAQVIVLHYVEQLSTNEIADLLNISQASAKTHLQRARRNLGERLRFDPDGDPDDDYDDDYDDVASDARPGRHIETRGSSHGDHADRNPTGTSRTGTGRTDTDRTDNGRADTGRTGASTTDASTTGAKRTRNSRTDTARAGTASAGTAWIGIDPLLRRPTRADSTER